MDSLTEALLQPILAGDWRPHDRLPSEHALAAQHEVSRAVVREAIARLKSDGYVETRQGKGAFVAAAPGGNAFRLNDEEVRDDLLELRALIEADCAALAAERHTAADLAALRAASDAMRDAVAKGGLGLAEDIRFHDVLADAAHNPALRRFAAFVGRHAREAMQLARLSHLKEQNRLAEIEAEHAAIIAAVAARDALAARAAVQHHIASGLRRHGLS
ncbi:FadR/GntR family transcriptional regulator [Ferrovibrio terrae]|uniref:FadR/GntR family transcriptional regulator n=1 Tax=Ferrovibrio terrae TaxID=2594003 RepID=UPI00163DC74B|nr:FCD domain-containing protein [Ferrovibrio terrae]